MDERFRDGWRSSAMALVAVGFLLSAAPADGAGCPVFGSPTVMGTVGSMAIAETSGLVASRKNPGVLWVHNDSGDSARVFALSTDGALLAIYNLTDASATDWEDIALGPGPEPGTDYLYIADIGDNGKTRPFVTVYRVAEPEVDPGGSGEEIDISGAVALEFEYADGPHNAETLLSDPLTGDLYVVTKSSTGGVSRVFPFPFPQSGSSRTVLTEVTSFQLEGASMFDRIATGGDISPDGVAIVVRTYTQASLWLRAGGQTVVEALSAPACPVPLAAEPQGEAIAFEPDGGAYLTTSEFTSQPIYRHELNACTWEPRTCDAPARSLAVFKDKANDDKDAFLFKFINGPVSGAEVFGDPLVDTRTSFCLYLDGLLEGAASVPPGAGWKERRERFRFSDASGSNGGVTRIKLSAGETGDPRETRIGIRGKGSAVPMPALPAEEPFTLTMQVTNTAGDDCWGDSFQATQVLRNDATVLKLKK